MMIVRAQTPEAPKNFDVWLCVGSAGRALTTVTVNNRRPRMRHHFAHQMYSCWILPGTLQAQHRKNPQEN